MGSNNSRCASYSLEAGVFMSVRISGEDELYPICMAHVRPSFMNSLSLLYQGNPCAAILSEQLLSRELLAQYIIL